MTFALQSAFTDNVSVIPAAVLNAWRVDINRALDGVNGGAYTPLVALEILGSVGLEVVTLKLDSVSAIGSVITFEGGATVDFDGPVNFNGLVDVISNWEVKTGAEIEWESGSRAEIQSGATLEIDAGAIVTVAAVLDCDLPTADVPALRISDDGGFARRAVLEARLDADEYGSIVATNDPSIGLTVNARIDASENFDPDANNTSGGLFVTRSGLVQITRRDSGSTDFTSWDHTLSINPVHFTGAVSARTIYPALVVKAFAYVTVTAGAPAVPVLTSELGFSAIGMSGADVELTLDVAMGAAVFGAIAQRCIGSNHDRVWAHPNGASTVKVSTSGDFAADNVTFTVLVIGYQA